MQIRLSPSMRSLTIATSNGFLDMMKVRVRHVSHRTLFHTILLLAFLLPFVFILTALVTLEGVNKCSTFDCLGRRYGPKFLTRSDDSVHLIEDFYNTLDQLNSEAVPDGLTLPRSFEELLSQMKNSHYDAKKFALVLKATMENLDREAKKSKMSEQINKHVAASSIPKGIHCLSLRLTNEYSLNALARRPLPSPESLHKLSDNSLHHFILASDNVLAASVVVNSTITSSLRPEKIVFHVITDKKTYSGMHSWFALNPMTPATIEVKGAHQFDFLTKENVPVLEAMERYLAVRDHYHGNHILKMNSGDSPRVLASKLLARSPKYISLLNHLRIYLPELFPRLDKVVFLDDDVVVQRDLSPLWGVDLRGKVNGAVETCKGGDSWVMSKRFRNYFNFSNPLISRHLNPDDCAWAYGMNIFDLSAWKRTDIREKYHFWLKENLKSNLTLWRFGTLPPALIAFRGHVRPISPSWHLLGLGYQEHTDMGLAQKAAVLHFNGQAKPWLDIGFSQLRPLWSKYVNYSDGFIKSCHILAPPN